MHFLNLRRAVIAAVAQLFVFQRALAATRTFELNISQGRLNPDCHDRSFPSLLVNGQFPAPPIRVTKNDKVHIIVRNNVATNQSTTIHYHGILQVGSCEADGVPDITQVSIAPGEVYHQRFQVVKQAGTYYYHAHVGLQDGTISGPFIVYDSEDAWPTGKKKKKITDGPYTYQDERVLFLSEWWHMTDHDRLGYYLGPSYNGMISANSYLLNGRTVAVDNNNTAIDPALCPGYSAIEVKPNTTYRLRVIGALTMASLAVSIAEHNLTVIEVDGALVAPYNVSYLEVAPGQRFSVLLHTHNNLKGPSYNIETMPLYVRETFGNGRAILKYTTSSENDRSYSTAWEATVATKPIFPLPRSQWFFKDILPLTNDVPSQDGLPDRTIVIKPSEVILADNTTRWTINGRMLMDFWARKSNDERPLPMLTRIKSQGYSAADPEMHDDGFDPVMGVFRAKRNEVLDIVIHTTALANGVCIGHPWHTHGHVHYVLADGPGEYHSKWDRELRTYPNRTIARDTTFIYPVQPAPPPKTLPGTICGWTKIRLYATNPGVWAVHCHITSHMVQGMMLVMEVTDRM
ncbi:Cupredoxin [Dichotomocladium elegans]|nr:Cupredoxin [Dichotomocladium elegans]